MEQKIFIISDTHFNHQMLVREDKRNFKSIDDMNELIIQNWNKKVSDEDLIYHLGDVALNRKVDYEKTILPRLKGQKIFIQGNHDVKNISITQSIIIKYFGILIEMVHKAMDTTKKTKIVLHGHVHKTGYQDMPFKGDYINDHIFKDLEGRYFYNCNLEYHKYKPKPLSEIIGEIKLIKKYKEIHISDLEKQLPKNIRQSELGEILGSLKEQGLIKKENNTIYFLNN